MSEQKPYFVEEMSKNWGYRDHKPYKPMDVRWYKIDSSNASARFPQRTSMGAAGHDVYAAYPVLVAPGQIVNVRTGIGIELPKGYYAQICDRSSIGLEGIITAGGVVDQDYRGEIGVTMINLSKKEFRVKSGDRVAQMIILPCQQNVRWNEIHFSKREKTDRDTKWSGSSGRNDDDIKSPVAYDLTADEVEEPVMNTIVEEKEKEDRD